MEGKVITVICPVFNEEKYIESVLNFFIKADPLEKELYVVDGDSTDKTTEIVKQWCTKHQNIKLLSNPHQTVPYALNMAISASVGDPIIRLDAHTVYADNYFEKIIETFKNTGADIVGGPMRATGKTILQKAIARATSTAFGIGDSSFHDENKSGYVDSVYLGAWKREIFKDTGLFDVQMKRNQDDEFHYRAKSKGKKIFLNPEIKSYYFPRDSFSKLFSQYFQYGLFKPLVIKKVKSEIKMRHLIPFLFVLYLLSLPFLFWFTGYFSILPGIFYVLLDIYFSVKFTSGIQEKLFSFLVYPVIHISYGTGFMAGILKLT